MNTRTQNILRIRTQNILKSEYFFDYRDRREQQQIPSPLVEDRRILEDAQAAGAEAHKAEPLKYGPCQPKG